MLIPYQLTSTALGPRVIKNASRCKFRREKDYGMVRVKSRVIVFRNEYPSACAVFMPIVSGILQTVKSEILFHAVTPTIEGASVQMQMIL